MLRNLILTVVASAVVWVASEYIRYAPALIYYASDPIEVPGVQGRSEFAQEIIVLNQGRVAARAVSIRIPRGISSYQLHKHSNLAREASQSGGNNFELLYPELPPEQRITLFVRYDGNPVAREWIAVGHSAGNAAPLDKPADPVNPLLLLGVFWCGFTVSLLFDLRRQQTEKFVRRADRGQLLANERPWFAAAARWSEIQYEAIVEALVRRPQSGADNSFAHELLNRPKPALLRDEHWSDVRSRAGEMYLMECAQALLLATNRNQLTELAGRKKPEHLPWQDWERLQEAVQQRLYDLLMPLRQNAVDYLGLLDPGRSPLRDLPEALAMEVRTAAQEQYFRQLIRRSTDTWGDPASVLQTARLDLLSDEQESRLRQHVEQLGRMRKMPHSWDPAELKVFLAEGRPDWMPEQEFAAIGKFVEKIDDLADEDAFLRKREKRAKAAQLEADNLRKQALAQLGLIDRVLMNPEAADSLEDYSEVFSAGDLRSLERVAWLLRSARPAGEVTPLGSVGAERRLRDSGNAGKR
ncbi:MAG: hypothetical protein HYU74_09920 [Dechloromonas sp.]|nr:hypothetical protein [Dechloromonas sp.]